MTWIPERLPTARLWHLSAIPRRLSRLLSEASSVPPSLSTWAATTALTRAWAPPMCARSSPSRVWLLTSVPRWPASSPSAWPGNCTSPPTATRRRHSPPSARIWPCAAPESMRHFPKKWTFRAKVPTLATVPMTRVWPEREPPPSVPATSSLLSTITSTRPLRAAPTRLHLTCARRAVQCAREGKSPASRWKTKTETPSCSRARWKAPRPSGGISTNMASLRCQWT